MRRTFAVLFLGAALLSLPAMAGGHRVPSRAPIDTVGSEIGRAPWNADWEYDSGSGNDHRPELPYYQQGRGQQTGGPARNLLPDDGLRIFPR